MKLRNNRRHTENRNMVSDDKQIVVCRPLRDF